VERETGWYWCEGDPPDTAREWTSVGWRGEPRTITYRRLTVAAQIAIFALGTSAALDAYGALLTFQDLDRILDSFGTDVGVAEDARRSAEIFRRVDRAADFAFALQVATGIAWLVWFRKAYNNLLWLHGSCRNLSRVVWPWFVPIVSMYLPYKLMKELRPYPPTLHDDRAARIAPNPTLPSRPISARPISARLLLSWWLLWVVCPLLSLLGPFFGTETKTSALIVYGLLLASYVGIIFAAFLAIVIVRRVTDYQESFVERQPQPEPV